IPKLRELLETILPQKATFDNYEVEHDFATIGKRIMLLNARQIQRVLGKERIILLAIEDITERKEIENGLKKAHEELKELAIELKRTARVKSEFLANMSHELRTPLNSIIGYTKLILNGIEGEINDEQRQDLKTVYANSKHLLELINDLLNLSRIEAGKTVLNYGIFTISDLLSGVIPIINQLAREKGLDLTYTVDPTIEHLYADKAKTKQVLINILDNAIKFTNNGSVKLNVAEDDNTFVFSVSDTGIGIKKEDLEVIFDSFKQVGPAQIAGYEGTGLGLTISKNFIELQGGRIWAESELGKGSTFTFTLPKKKIANP
ncbi:MAG: HAMP domain-containing histidine kinase, partial [Dehalococcoidia bacterium]|nr:HAMP domain-containing histidine kinase [Dehalococcoidia bacterium]